MGEGEATATGTPSRRRTLLRVVGGVLLALVAIQFIPIARTNPPIQRDVEAPADVKAVLRESCYNCHSNETQWPWYARVAPASWLVARDVRHGRGHINFSTWDLYDAEGRGHIRKGVGEVIGEGEMPPWFYLPLHPEARLTAEDRTILEAWAAGAGEASASDHSTHDHSGHDHGDHAH